MKRRIVSLATVVALMMVMLAMSVAPAFAGWQANGCRTDGTPVDTGEGDPFEFADFKDRNENDVVCFSVKTRAGQEEAFYYDDHPQT